MKTFKGKAIYNPSGKAREYSEWACNFYVGCSNDCTYCYCKKGVLGHAMGANTATLKKCFRNIGHAKDVFEKEMLQNKDELRKHGLFLSFTTDPMLSDTIELTVFAISCCLCANIPVKILTKRADWVDGLIEYLNREFYFDLSCLQNIAFGFTLTGHDELETGASTNQERIEAMKKLHDAGFKTFASIEPIIDFESSKEMIRKTAGYCDLYKIGLESGKKYSNTELLSFIDYCNSAYITESRLDFYRQKNYFKDSLLIAAGIDRSVLPSNCVGRDYNIFQPETTEP